MKVEITKKSKNIALKRDEVEAKITEVGATPSREEIRERLAALLAIDKGLIVVEEVKSGFGVKTFTAKMNIYRNKEDMKATEHSHILKRNFGEEKKEQSAAPAVAAK